MVNLLLLPNLLDLALWRREKKYLPSGENYIRDVSYVPGPGTLLFSIFSFSYLPNLQADLLRNLEKNTDPLLLKVDNDSSIVVMIFYMCLDLEHKLVLCCLSLLFPSDWNKSYFFMMLLHRLLALDSRFSLSIPLLPFLRAHYRIQILCSFFLILRN